jgi:WD40 repeat protein
MNQSGKNVVVCDDDNNIQIYKINDDNKLELSDTIKNPDQKSNYEDLSCINFKDDLLIAATSSKGKNLYVWKGNKQIVHEQNIPQNHEFKKCHLVPAQDHVDVVVLHTARGSSTMIAKYRIKDDKHKKILEKKILNKPFPYFTISRSQDEFDERFLGIGTPDGGVNIYDLETLRKRYSQVPGIHGFPITACDIWKNNHLLDHEKLLVCTGSFDKSVAIHTASTELPTNYYLYFMAFVVLLLGIIYATYFNKQ